MIPLSDIEGKMMAQGTPETKLNKNEQVSNDDGRVEWERPALRRLAANEAQSKGGTMGFDSKEGSGS
jgi:hypothetical protein